ncbi:MAG: hypothetical protein WCI27_05370 [Candidatus Omnitrophota bacterium]
MGRKGDSKVSKGSRIENNFKKRFGDPPRIYAVYPKEPVPAAEREWINKNIAKAVFELMKDILGRDPIPDEFSGRVSIEESLKKAKAKRKQVVPDYQI